MNMSFSISFGIPFGRHERVLEAAVRLVGLRIRGRSEPHDSCPSPCGLWASSRTAFVEKEDPAPVFVHLLLLLLVVLLVFDHIQVLEGLRAGQASEVLASLADDLVQQRLAARHIDHIVQIHVVLRRLGPGEVQVRVAAVQQVAVALRQAEEGRVVLGDVSEAVCAGCGHVLLRILLEASSVIGGGCSGLGIGLKALWSCGKGVCVQQL
mmetsp:Transcript_5985/g.8389  ORF Transcript_5985/g.8389 Transcript_5985/m.8389 type:complete len:209 (+) Transcript_5985:533-1159(+)